MSYDWTWLRFEKIRIIDRLKNKVICQGKNELKTYTKMIIKAKEYEKNNPSRFIQFQVKIPRGWMGKGYSFAMNTLIVTKEFYEREGIKTLVKKSE